MREVKFLFSICLLMILCFSCKGDEDLSAVVFSEEVSIEDGTVKSFVNLDKNGNPASIGIEISNEVIASNFPTEDIEYKIPLPLEADNIPFKGIGLNWKPNGHTPSYVCESPYFDIRFYTISESQRDQITPESSDDSYTAPDPQYLPNGYILIPASAEPGMGASWIDLEEFKDGSFNQIVIYGFHGGEMTFIESMIKFDFFSRAKRISSRIKQPDKYEQVAYYPTTYSMDFYEDKVVINLGDMVLR